MAISTFGKIDEMQGAWKIDESIIDEYTALTDEHKKDKQVKMATKRKFEDAKESYRKISVSRPLKKFRALRTMQRAKLEYKDAKSKLKSSQIAMRNLKNSIRDQYKVFRANEKLKHKVEILQKSKYISIDMSTLLQAQNQESLYDRSIYSKQTGYGLPSPDENLVKKINELYRTHMVVAAKAKVGLIPDVVKTALSNTKGKNTFNKSATDHER